MTKLMRVLIAEDNEDHLFLTVRALKSLGGVEIEVDAVNDGAEALDYIYRRGRFENRPRPHLILLDIKMPRVDGFGVLEQIKSDPELRSIPVVVLTSSERPEDIENTYQLGGNCYVTKPVSQGKLREGILELAGFWLSLSSLPEPPE